MKRYITLFVLVFFLIPYIPFAQKGSSADFSTSRPNNIHSGFTLKVGPVFPFGKFASG